MKRFLFVFGIIFCLAGSTFATAGTAYARDVYYNPDSRIWHNRSCQHSHCKYCKKIDLVEAEHHGGRACKKCGG